MASIHETAEGLHAAGVMNKRTLREFDELCLTPVQPLKSKEIRAIRLREGASQAVFARYLNVTTDLVSQWERGQRHPQGASLKLLTLVARSGLESVAAWNKDPVFGVIGIQSGPRELGVHSGFHDHGSRGWDADRGDDCQDSPRFF